MVYNGHHNKMGDLEVPPCKETSIYQFLNVDLLRVPGESFVMGLESLTGFHRTGWRFQKTQSEREKSEETRCLPSFEFNVYLPELN